VRRPAPPLAERPPTAGRLISMSPSDATCWTLIRDAAGGDPAARERFARAYLPVVRAYLAARWRTAPHCAEDAAQDVFVECFRAGGLAGGGGARAPGRVPRVPPRPRPHRRAAARTPPRAGGPPPRRAPRRRHRARRGVRQGVGARPVPRGRTRP